MNIVNISSHNLTFPDTSDELKSTATPDTVAMVALMPSWSKVCVIVFIVIAMLIGIPGNGLVMTVLLKIPKKTSTDVFVIVIALFDILSLCVTGTTTITVMSSEIWTKVASIGLCQFYIYFTHFLFLQSTFLITCVGVDRYFKTCRPHSTLFTDRKAFRSSLCFSFLSGLISVPVLFTNKLNNQGYCVFDPLRANLRLSVYTIMVIIVLVNSVLVCVLYSRIGIKIRARVNVHPDLLLRNLSGTNTTRGSMFSNRRKNQPMDTVLSTHGPSCSSTVKTKNSTTKVSFISKQVNQELPFQKQTSVFDGHKTCSTSFITVRPGNSTTIQDNITPGSVPGHRQNTTHMNPDVSRKLQQVNKTTKIMAAITLAFILSTSLPLVAVVVLSGYPEVRQSQVGIIVISFMTRLGFISSFSNPIFYIWLSSVFRKNASKTLKSCRRESGSN